MAIIRVPTVGGPPGVRSRFIALVLFLGFWVFVRWLVQTTWEDGEPFPVVVVEWLVLPFVAGVLAGWWRGPHTGPAALLTGGLFAVLVVLVELGILMEIWTLFTGPPLDLLSFDWDLPLLFILIGFVLGSFGAMLSSIVAVRVASSKAHSHL